MLSTLLPRRADGDAACGADWVQRRTTTDCEIDDDRKFKVNFIHWVTVRNFVPYLCQLIFAAIV